MYKEVEHSLIRIDELPSTFNPAEMEIIFDGIRVVLCTLSALSNPALLDKRLFSLVRMQNLIIDEASQISIFNYLVGGYCNRRAMARPTNELKASLLQI